jgi:hypothetical protein
MAVDAAEVATAAVARRPRSSGQDWADTGRKLYQRVSSPSMAAQTVTKLLWAVAVFLIVLEIAASATGQRWSFSLPGTAATPTKPYVPLYQGQALPTAAAAQSVAASMPGVAGAPEPPTVPLSNRSAGNQGV